MSDDNASAAPPPGRDGRRPGAGAGRGRRRRELSTWWYLIYLGTLGFQPLFDPTTTAGDWVLTGAVAAVGVVLYAAGELRPGRARLVATLAFAALGAAAVWVNSGAAVMFVYAAAFAGTFEPRAVAQRWLLGLTAAVAFLALASPIPMPYRLAAFGFPLVFVWVVGSQVMDDAERQRETARLRVDNVRIERLATLSERERIARDLHDLLGHTLTGIVVRAQLIRRLVDRDPQRAADEAGDVERLAREALAEVRATVSGWRHHALDAELDAAHAALAAADVALAVDRDPQLSLSPSLEAAMALAVREAVTNVVRHASASTCRIGLVSSGDRVMLTVADDGVGGAAPDGSGMTGMRERIAALGGQVERHGRGGTRLTVTVPAEGVPA